ncbi:uridylate kinase [Methylobacillus gramineus]|uniref:amino acid kinase family protein n=1 Tax=Methylobacillus gramineus TaxID=755169 RepID=UPI001CFF68E9|nr:uridylate kinase [Methylobacillus gramineus]MCB5184485.1 uridylate kinase [Methylobacillus gramineus]
MWVIKLGGSLLGSPELNIWLDTVARHGDGKVLIVPGGGIFADAVRDAQISSGIDDATAHRMAVMAMDQYGVLMTGLSPRLVTARSELEIAERGWQHRGIVWLPSDMVCADDTIPMNWEITSDSLAAHLAAKLNAEHLILVKSSRPDADQQVSLEKLTKEGFVDAGFGDHIAGKAFNTWVVGRQDCVAFSEGFVYDELERVGLPVRCSWN